MTASEELLKQHYGDLAGKPFFAGLVKHGRQMLGETNPLSSLPGSLRGDLSVDLGRNIIHGSDSVDSANKEIALWFKDEELQRWKHPLHEAVYE